MNHIINLCDEHRKLLDTYLETRSDQDSVIMYHSFHEIIRETVNAGINYTILANMFNVAISTIERYYYEHARPLPRITGVMTRLIAKYIEEHTQILNNIE